MKILILATHCNTGGITSYILTLTKGLAQKGHSVHVVTSGGDREQELEKIGAIHTRLDIRTKSEVSYKVFTHIPALVKLVRQGRCDVIHAQTRVTQVVAAIVSFFTRVPYVATCHGFFKPRFFRRIFPCWGNATIAISQQVKEHLINDFSCDPNSVFLVPHGLDVSTKEWTPQEREERKNVLGLRSKMIIGIVARLSDVKGHDVLIRAMPRIIKQIPDADLVIVGQGKTEPFLKKLVRELFLEGRVHFFSSINGDDNLLPLFDVFVMPSRQEGLGLSVMEAQAQGLAVVASNVGGIPSLIESGKTGVLVDKENPAQLAGAIVDLLKDPDKRKKIACAAQAFAIKNFSLDPMVHGTLQAYAQARKL
ncbi:MAG TPA: glycosyltransferase family 4 protein [Candidatus Omnitrophota bacterium]|nr:glycosyltransferase family 4 protein [Candidatus Omnitrophota bacterium]HQL41372.1 glycosyltransferase family 4 protein [Candidatus Omnitrophota bacterium]